MFAEYTGRQTSETLQQLRTWWTHRIWPDAPELSQLSQTLAVTADKVEISRHFFIRCAMRMASVLSFFDWALNVTFIRSADQRAEDGDCFPSSIGSKLD